MLTSGILFPFSSLLQLKLHLESHLEVRPVFACRWEGCQRVYATVSLEGHALIAWHLSPKAGAKLPKSVLSGSFVLASCGI